MELKIPVYKSKTKKALASVLAFMLHKKACPINKEDQLSRIDFSEFITPDEWIIYKVNKKNILLIAMPKFMQEHKSCWEINLVPEFFQEDLRYGVKPISIYEHLPLVGAGSIIFGKASNKIYHLGSAHWVRTDVAKEYDKFINNEKSSIAWESLEMKAE